MPSSENVRGLVHEITRLDRETEWIEFKRENADPAEIGEYCSALANGAARVGKSSGYLVWGVDDATHEIVGTSFDPYGTKIGNEELENWLVRGLSPKIDIRFVEASLPEGRVVLLEIPRAQHTPIQFNGQEFIRIGSIKQPLKRHPQVERELWRIFETTPIERLVAADNQSTERVEALLDVAGYFDLLNRPHPEDPRQG